MSLDEGECSPNAKRSLETLRWLLFSKPQLALFDQCLVSGGRFLATWLVGRLAGPEALGTYSIAMAGIVFTGAIQESLVIRPFQTFLYRQPLERRKVFSGSALAQMLIIAVLLSLGLFIAGAVLRLAGGNDSSEYVTLLVLALCVPGTLIAEFSRRFSLASQRISTAILIDSALIFCLLLGHLSLSWLDSFDAYRALLMVGFVNIVIGSAIMLVLRNQFRWAWLDFRKDLATNLRFGRWLCGSQTLGVIHGYLVPWLVYSLISADAAGRLSASYTLILFSNPLILGYSIWLGPQAARTFVEDGTVALKRLIARSACLLASGLVVYWILLATYGEPLLTTIFGDDYAGLGSVVGWLGATALGFGLSVCGSNGLAALQRPGIVLLGTIVGICITSTSYFVLTPIWQLTGAAAALAMGALTSGAIQLLMALTVPPLSDLSSTRSVDQTMNGRVVSDPTSPLLE